MAFVVSLLFSVRANYAREMCAVMRYHFDLYNHLTPSNADTSHPLRLIRHSQ